MIKPDAFNEYVSAKRAGKRYLKIHSRDGFNGHLPNLETLLINKKIVGEATLGSYDIPLNKIVGTCTCGRGNDYSGSFMPLLTAKSEFAQKWEYVYSHQVSDGISEPIKTYEYMGEFFVSEGNKRVSVMNHVDAISIYGDVTRLIPLRTDDYETSVYYEKLDYDLKGFWYTSMNFTKRGDFEGLVAHATKFADKTEAIKQKELRYWLPQIFREFDYKFNALFRTFL